MGKDAIRRRIWNRLKRAGAGQFPSPADEVPNFRGAEQAANLLRRLTIWRRARTVKCDTSAPQLWLRRAALEEGKVIYLPVPGLRAEHCFIEIDPAVLGSRAWRAASLRGALAHGRLVSPSELPAIDFVLVGSVACNRQGATVGPGGRGRDLEFGILRQLRKVREYTPIVTTVHPLQVIDERIPMAGHDVPIDFAVTPENVIAAPSLYPRPRGVLWDLLPNHRVRAIPCLRRERRETGPLITPGRF